MQKFMKLFSKFVFLIIVSNMLWACNNKVDINSDYRDIAIVYGLLDPSEKQHFIKLTKAFQADGNVYIAASDGTISQYDPKDIKMWIDEYSNGNFIRTISLDTVLVINKDSGAFYHPNQIVYATPLNTILNANNEYRLQIENKSTGKTINGQTNIIHDFNVNKPNSNQKYVGLTSSLPQTVEWSSAVNGLLYQLNIRFFYTEVDGNGNKSVHHVELPFGTEKSNSTLGGEKMVLEFYGETFYQNMAAKVSLPSAGMKRYADSLYYIFTVADENFSIYMDLNKPSTGIVSERPSYTNIENGIGIFAGRYNKKRTFLGLSPSSIDTLISGQYTNQLGFVKYIAP
ncbi:MAG: hypothetical protein AUJ98_08000 [Bacteroidetes bacterium CG2_30_33_31]|nr:MAG: hypothetical protein AUJ98_08000 [Bacteroidetes bacterium CG2_30_33_31]